MKKLEGRENYEIWTKVYSRLCFNPSCEYRCHSMEPEYLPFEIQGDYRVYGIEDMNAEQIELLYHRMDQIFADITPKGCMIYALDWQHESFIYDPSEETIGDSDEWYPEFLPCGDYYFFIKSDFEFGYLGHPLRNEIWIFGEKLIREIESVYSQFEWKKLI